MANPARTMPGANGGTLNRGGTFPGAGRPKSALREQMRGDLEESLPAIRAVLRGIREQPDGTVKLTADQRWAIELLARYGVGTADEVETTVKVQPLTIEERRREVVRLLSTSASIATPSSHTVPQSVQKHGETPDPPARYRQTHATIATVVPIEDNVPLPRPRGDLK